jgi:hypothetical protein
MAFYNQIRIKAGFGETLSDSDNIEAFTPTGGSPQKFKAGNGGMVYLAASERVFSEGEPRYHPDGSVSFAGFQTVTYTQPGMHPDSYAWLIANYRGDVTCYVAKDGTTWYSVRYIFTLLEAL